MNTILSNKKNQKFTILLLIGIGILKIAIFLIYNEKNFGEYEVFDSYSSRILSNFNWLFYVNIYELSDFSIELKKLPLFSIYFSLNKYLFNQWESWIKFSFILITIYNLYLFSKFLFLRINNPRLIYFSIFLFAIGLSFTSDITLWMDSFYGNILISSILILILSKNNRHVLTSSILFCLALTSRISIVYIAPIYILLFIYLFYKRNNKKLFIKSFIYFVIPIFFTFILLINWNAYRTDGNYILTTNASTGLMIPILKLKEYNNNLKYEDTEFNNIIFNFEEYLDDSRLISKINNSYYLKSRLINFYFIKNKKLSHIEVANKTKNLFYNLINKNFFSYIDTILIPNIRSSIIYISSSYLSPTSRLFEILWYDDKYDNFKKNNYYFIFKNLLLLEKIIFSCLLLIILSMIIFKKKYRDSIFSRENNFLFLFALFWWLIHLLVGIEARYLYPINWIIIYLINYSLSLLINK